MQAGVNLITGLTNGIKAGIDAGGVLAAFSTMFDQLWAAVSAIDWATIVGNLIGALTTWIATTFPTMLDQGVQLLTNLANGLLAALPGLISSAGYILSQLVWAIMQALPRLLSSGVRLVGSLAQGLLNNIPAILGAIYQAMARLLFTIGQNYPKLLQSGLQLMAKMVAGIIQAIPKIIGTIPKIWSQFSGAFKGYNWGSIGTQIMQGVANGVRNGASQIVNAAKNAAKRALDAAKNFLGIHSPSRVFRDQVGKNMALGIAEGYEDYMPYSRFVAATDRVTRAAVNASEADVSATGGDMEAVLAAINTLGDRISRIQMVVDTGALVGEMAEEMNAQLGYMAKMEAMA